MGIKWGEYSNGLRVGVEVTQSPETVGSSTSSVSVRARVYVGAQPGVDVSVSGTVSVVLENERSTRFAYDSRVNGREHLIQTESTTIFTDYEREKLLQISARLLRLSGLVAAPTVEYSHTVSKRPVAPPRDVTIKEAYYMGTGSTYMRVEWGESYGSVPVKAYHVERFDEVGGAWVRVNTSSQSSTTYYDYGVQPDTRYKYRVYADNGVLSSRAEPTPWVLTVPSAPADVRAVRRADNSVRITWRETTRIPEGVSYRIYSSTGSYVGQVNAGVREFVIRNAPTSNTLTYQVSAYANVKYKFLEGYAHTGNTYYVESSKVSVRVQPLAKPNAPTTASIPVTAVGENPTISFTHSPRDDSAQTAYEIRLKKPGETQFTSQGKRKNADSNVTFPGLTRPGEYQWQVRTWGEYQPDSENGASPWSQVATFQIYNRPVVRVTNPGTTVDSSTPRITWQYTQAERHAQVESEAELSNASRGLLEKKVVRGAKNRVVFNTPLEHGEVYTVRVRVQSSSGLKSAYATHFMTANFPLPNTPQITVAWSNNDGWATITVVNPPGGNKPTVVRNQVHRSINGGETWELIPGADAPNTVVTDYAPPTKTEVTYRVSAFTEPGAAAHATISTIAPPEIGGKFWLNAGALFSQKLAFEYNTKISEAPNLSQRVLHQFAGRTYPVEFSSTTRSHQFQFSAEYAGEENSLLVNEFFYHSGPFLYRDPRGVRILVSPSSVRNERVGRGWWRLSVTLDQVSE